MKYLHTSLYLNSTLFFLFILLMPQVKGQSDYCKKGDTLGVKSLFTKAQFLHRQGKLDEAVVNFEKAREIYKQIGCKDMGFLMNRNILKVHTALGNVAAFNTLYQNAIAAVAKPVDKAEAVYKGRIYLLKSNFHLSQKQLDSAQIFSEMAKDLHEKQGAWKYYIRDNIQLARISYFKQNFEDMELFLDNCFSAHKTYLKDQHRTLQEIMQLYGILYFKTGDYEVALEKTTEALEVALLDMSTKEDTSFVASCYNNMGLFYIQLGDIYKAEDYCNNALRLYSKLGDHFEAATTYLNLGEFFGLQGKTEDALDFYKEGIASLEKAQKVPGIPQHKIDQSFISMYNGIGDVATKLHRYTEAFDALKMSLEIHKHEESKQDETYSVLGVYYVKKGAYDKALECFQKVLGIRQQYYGNIHPLVASVYFELGETEHKRNNLKAANDYYVLAEKALEVSSDNDEEMVSDRSILLQILDAKARISMEQGDLAHAYAMAQSATSILENMRNGFKEEGSKLFMLQKMIPTYELSIELAYNLYEKNKDFKYIEDAFQLVEKSKAMLLLDALKTEEARNFGNVPKELLDEERRLARERVRYEKLLFEAKANGDQRGIDIQHKELLKLKRASEKLQTTLEKEYPKYHQLKYDTKIANLSEIQASLDAKTALIEYFVGNDKIYIFGIYQDTAWMTPVSMNSKFVVAVKGLRASITDVAMVTQEPSAAYTLFAKNARTIYQKYLEPVLKKEGINRLILIPDGLLNYVPFDVLLTEKPNYSTPDYKTLPYLIRQYNINYHYSSTLKLFSRSAKATNGKMLAMSSSYNKKEFINMKDMPRRDHKIRSSVDDLPGAKREVEFLAETFAGKFLYGKNANEEAFKNFTRTTPFSVIHLAMHGVVDSKQPDYSSLVFTFTGNKEEDDFLHAYELNLLEMNPDLVVLSACETGFGKYERGEGVVSLGRGFMYAGAPSLVMTLWPINDKATSLLISEFYNQLAEGYCKDEAMRNAKLSYLEKSKKLSSHPFFWASFINLGNYEPIYLYKHWPLWQKGLCALPVVLLLIYLVRRRFSHKVA